MTETDQERFSRTALSSLEMTDEESAAVVKYPEGRISLNQIKDAIRSEEVIRPMFAPHMTIVVMMLNNGWLSVGTSAPAEPRNFDAELGVKFAREDAIRKLWPLFAFAKLDRDMREMPSFPDYPEDAL